MLGKCTILQVSKVSRIHLYLLIFSSLLLLRLKPILTTERKKVNAKKKQLQCKSKQEVVKKYEI